MDAKLVFDEKYYYLEVQHERIGKMIVGSSDHELSRIVNHPFKLCTKNCEVIKNDYDLDELAHNHAEGNDNYLTAENSFIEGAKTILELLGDKKFSEEDLVSFGKRCFYKGFEKSENDDANCYTAFREEIGELIQSLQQTDWDVEIVMEKEVGTKLHDDGREFFMIDGTKPKLDANGCIILKRK